MITCKKCGLTKNASDYSPQKGSKTGRAYRCKACKSDDVKAHNQRLRTEIGDEAYLAKGRASVRRFRATDKGQKASATDNAVLYEARRRLIAAHRKEYDHLLTVVRYELEHDDLPTV